MRGRSISVIGFAAGRATNGCIVTVEDHYAHGGLGDGVAEAVWDQGFIVRRLAVREIPRSGPSEELLDRYGISARAIVDAVRALVARTHTMKVAPSHR